MKITANVWLVKLPLRLPYTRERPDRVVTFHEFFFY